MFDTSVVRARAIAAPRSGTFIISVLMHSIAVAAAVALTVASTPLPPQPPRQLELYRPVELPSAPPPPLGPPRPEPHAVTPQPRPQNPLQITAPPAIPDQTPSVEPIQSATPGSGDTTEQGPIGNPDGVPGGVPDGVAGGQGPPGSSGTGTGPYRPGSLGVTSAKVITRVEPRFPQALIHAVRHATVVVRCVIGKDGQIRDPEIVMSSFPPFSAAVLDALRQWKFEPGTLHGQPVDTYFELTVRFEVR